MNYLIRYRSNLIALCLSLIAFLAAGRVAADVYENIPHLEDELAYVWQANVIAAGKLTIPAPEYPRQFLVPFVVDHEGQRFGKYPLGFPVVLSLGILAGVRSIVNPLLAALAVWFSYRLGQTLMGDLVGLLMAGLTVSSPFFLINAGSLLSHPLSLFLSVSFALFWLSIFDASTPKRQWLAAVTAGLLLGMMGLTRPYSALAVALPFGLHGIYQLFVGSWQLRRQILGVGFIAGLVAALHFGWQWAATGDPFLNPYTLWWPYDKVGFGLGYGVTEAGHNLTQAWHDTQFSLSVGYGDLFGWFNFSYLFVPFGLWAIRKNWRTWLAAAPFFALVLFYLAYWVGSWLFGPRYYFDGLFSLTLLTAAGIAWLAGWPLRPEEPAVKSSGIGKIRPLAVLAILAALVFFNLIAYLPMRLESMHNLYGISAARMVPFQHPEFVKRTPAVIVVHGDHWTDYGTLLELQDPFLTTPFIFSFGGKEELYEDLPRLFPDRAVYFYYPNEPWRLYSVIRE